MKTIISLLALFAFAAPAAAAPAPASPAAAPSFALPPGHVPVGAASANPGNIKVTKATDPDARTVAEVITKRKELNNKTVVVRGKVVKYNSGIMKKNWVHLRDGTGSETDGSNDLLVTTHDEAKVGDVVVAKGVVHIDQDFGMGYSYEVLVDDAKLKK